MRSFASDNNATVCPEVIQKLKEVNIEHAIGYGDDKYTKQAIEYFKGHFGNETDIYFVFTGTSANVLGISAVVNPYHSVICARTSHLNVDECSAPERFLGAKLIPVDTGNGKLSRETVSPYLVGFNFEHHAQPKVISISQPTELGTVYSVEEIKELSEIAHENNMFLHMDGARLANASVALNKTFADMTLHAGVDILSFGGTKNGLMAAEAVIFFNKTKSKDFKYIRKQGMQLGSKMRFIAAQFLAYFENDLWKINALNANNMAKILTDKLHETVNPDIVYPVQTNAVFAKISKELTEQLQKEFFFYIWDDHSNVVRWMTSWDTTKKDIDLFIQAIARIVI